MERSEDVTIHLTRHEYADVVGHLLAIKGVMVELTAIFASDPTKRGGVSGTEAMAAAIDHVLDALGYVVRYRDLAGDQ